MDKRKLRALVEGIVFGLLDEATHRKDLVDAFRNNLSGAFGEHLKARFAELWDCSSSYLVSHWDREVDAHFAFEFDRLCRRRIKGSYDRLGAFEEALVDLEVEVPSEEAHSRTLAAAALSPSDKEVRRRLPTSAVESFFARARAEFEARTSAEILPDLKPKTSRGRGKKKFSR